MLKIPLRSLPLFTWPVAPAKIQMVLRPVTKLVIGVTCLMSYPRRIHGWMPRLAEEGVVGADAIFACLGPALEVFSRYSRVEKASGEAVTLKEYLEQVWAAVSKEALTMIFSGADATGFRGGCPPHCHVALDPQNGQRQRWDIEESEGDDEDEGGCKQSEDTRRIRAWSTTLPGKSPKGLAPTWKA